MLWPEHEQSRKRLRHAVWAAKKAVGEGCLIIEKERIGFRHGDDVWLDVTAFERLLGSYASLI